tara:strand:+ start:838 stop:2073 length:1236 start_codon:yes stop_codon:yes gene_type:complete
MVNSNQKFDCNNNGYIPFDINRTNKENKSDGILVLQDGTYFLGRSFGAKETSSGEICFNTSMTGYQEILTDPSYANQIITFTFPHIGNVGINAFDEEGNTNSVAGLVVRQYPTNPNNWRAEQSFNDWLIANKIPGISGIDTRNLTKIIRKFDSCNALISHNPEGNFNILELKNKLNLHPKMNGLHLSSRVSTKTKYLYNQKPHSFIKTKFNESSDFIPNIVVIDFGVKKNILRNLVNINANVTILSEDTNIEAIKDINPHGIFLSNGPGDPAATARKCDILLKSILELKLPVFGICIGHQLLAISLGAKTNKMKQGHRGANHPVKNLLNSKVEITSQNHGYEVDKEKLPKCFDITHISLFDQSIEGLRHKTLPFFSVQYHPEASPGPTDSSYLFQDFLNLMKLNIKNAKTY